MNFRQFLDNYRIYRERIRKPYATLEKSDLKYALWHGLVKAGPALIFGLIFFAIFCYIIIYVI